MKIIFYTPVNLLIGGGSSRWHCDITNSLKTQFGYSVEIITGNLGEKTWSEKYLDDQLQGIRHTRLKFINIFGVLIPTPSIVFVLYKKFRNADAIHFIYGFMGQDILMVLLKFITGKKIVVGHHAPIFYASKIHNFYMSFISRYLMNLFDAHQVLNSSDKFFLEEQWKIKNVYFIPSGIRTEKFLNTKKIKHKGLVFIAVGRYVSQKGFDLALKAIAKFNKEYKNNSAVFKFAGEGVSKPLIGQYAREYKNIKDLGKIDYEQIGKIYGSSDIYFLPSREEPFGLVLIEAWVCGLPVLATKTEGPKDMLIEDVNGWFIENINVEGIYRGISSLYRKYISDKLYFNRFENKCKKTGESFSIDKTARRMNNELFVL